MSDKHFLVEDQDIHDEVIVLGPSVPHQLEELERDLLEARHHYHELGQRASALASERDAVAARLVSARADAESARRQLKELQTRSDSGAAALETRLQSQQAELEEQRRQRQHLEARLAQTEQRIEALRDQFEQEYRARDSERVAQLDALAERLAAAGEENARLEAQNKALALELEQAQVSAAEQDAAREQIGALDQRIAELEAERGTALETARALEASLSAAVEQQHNSEARLSALEQERDTLALELDQAQTASVAERDAARKQIAAREQRIAELESELGTALETARTLEASLKAAAAQQQSTETQLSALEERIAELESERAGARQHTQQLETALTAAAEHNADGDFGVAGPLLMYGDYEPVTREAIEQTLREQRSMLEAELDNTRKALTRARVEREQACNEQARLTDTLGRVEQQLADTEGLNQAAREDAQARIVAAETEQRTLGEKVRQLAEQLHQQHQQQDRLEQQARDRKPHARRVRAQVGRAASRGGSLTAGARAPPVRYEPALATADARGGFA